MGPSKQLVGEFPPVTFERLYQYYYGWDMIKRSIDVMHQKFIGSGIEIKSNNEYFNVFVEKWWKTINAKQKFSDFFYSIFITGNGIMEMQYHADGRLGNIEHIPMQTIWRIFRDQFANELKLVQVVDGVFKELDPQFFVHWMINNPDRQAFGKSEFHSAASPRPVTGKVDINGEAVNAERTLRPLLDAQAILQNAEIEIKEKMGKPRLLVSAPGMPKDQMNEVQAEMADPNTDQYIWIFDKPIESSELQIQAQTKFDDYGNNVDAHIDIATGFASNVIKNPGSFSYSGGQTPLDVLDQRMGDLQDDAGEMIKDKLLKQLAESWGFKEFDEMDVEVAFIPTVRKPTLEDIRLLDPEAIAPKERRKMYEALNIPLDEQEFEEYQNEMKQDKQDDKDIQMTGAMMQPEATGFGGGKPGGFGRGNTPKGGGSSDAPKSQNSGKSGQVSSPKTPQAGKLDSGEPTPFKSEQPRPPTTHQPPQDPNKKKKGEVFTEEDVNNIAKRAAEEAVKLALERIPLPPSAGQNDNSSVDLYVSKGLDTPGTPEITDPKIRQEYGMDDRDESQLNELPSNAPQKRADLKNQPNIQPEGSQYTPTGVGIPEQGMKNASVQKSPQEYYAELERAGDEQSGGDTNDRINSQSDGTFKDPFDLNSETPPEEEVGQQSQSTQIAPRERGEPNNELPKETINPSDRLYIDSGGSKPDPEGKDQVLGSPDNDEQPIIPKEGDPRDEIDEEEVQKSIDLQQKTKMKRNVESSIKKGEAMNKDEFAVLPDAPEKQHRDNVKPEDRDPRLPFVDPDGEDNMEMKPQAQLDDTPLESNTEDTLEQTSNGVNSEVPHDMQREENGGDAESVDPAFTDVTGDSSQSRLRDEEEGMPNKDALLQNNSNFKLDNTNLNMKPDETPLFDQGSSKVINQDEYMAELTKKENPLEKEGDLPEDGMIMKPEEIQQNDSLYQGSIQSDDPNASPLGGDNVDQGVDTEDIDPNILHTDPETGRNYTDLTDEQGNEVPDLRFDQRPGSDEEQPEVELENPIVTKEEYEMEKESARGDPLMQGGEPPMISEDEFNAELDSKSTDPNAENPFDLESGEEPEEDEQPEKSEQEESPSKTSQQEKPQDKGEPKEGGSKKEETGKNNTGGKKDTTKQVSKDDGNEPEDLGQISEEPEEKKSSKPKETGKNNTGGKKSSDKKETSEEPEELENIDEEVEDEQILDRAKTLIDSGMDENQVNDTLIETFGEDRVKELVNKEEPKKKTKEVKKRKRRKNAKNT